MPYKNQNGKREMTLTKNMLLNWHAKVATKRVISNKKGLRKPPFTNIV